MAFLNLIVLLGLTATLKAASINVGENVTEEAVTINVREGLVPTLQEIGKAMLPISKQLHESEHNIIQNSTKSNASVQARFSFFGNNESTLHGKIIEKAYHRLRYVVQTTFKAIIEALVDIIRKTNGLPKLLYINFLICFGLFLGYGPGLLTFIGYETVLISSSIIRMYSRFLTPIHNTIQGALMAISPNIVDYVRKLTVQACSRGLSFILNHIKKGVEFDYAI